MTPYDQWRLAGPDEHPTIGMEEGDDCNRRRCKGTMTFHPVEGCRCHICPPCNACVDNPLVCDACGYGPDDEPTGDDDDHQFEKQRDLQMEREIEKDRF